jgi:hypothetical protein
MDAGAIMELIMKLLPFVEKLGGWIGDAIKRHHEQEQAGGGEHHLIASLAAKPEFGESLSRVIGVLDGILVALKKFQEVFALKA